MPAMPDILRRIRIAQLEASLKAGCAADAGAPLPSSSSASEVDLAPGTLDSDDESATARPSKEFSPESIMGTWTDSFGNKVSVYATDAFAGRLVATLSKPPRGDIHLKLKPVSLGGGWHCGDAYLDPMGSSSTQLFWAFPNGRVSIWTRPKAGDKLRGSGEDQAAAKALWDALESPCPAEEQPDDPDDRLTCWSGGIHPSCQTQYCQMAPTPWGGNTFGCIAVQYVPCMVPVRPGMVVQ